MHIAPRQHLPNDGPSLVLIYDGSQDFGWFVPATRETITLPSGAALTILSGLSDMCLEDMPVKQLQ